MLRRNLLRGVLAAPFAARQAAEAATSFLAGVEPVMTAAGGIGLGASHPMPPSSAAPKYDLVRRALMASPEARAALETMLYESNRHVYRLDPDLASKRSFSLAAKIAYQRQRNVAREIEEKCAPSAWLKVERFIGKITGMGGPIETWGVPADPKPEEQPLR